MSKHYWMLSTFIVFIITTVLIYFFKNPFFSSSTLLAFIPPIILGILKIIDIALRGKSISSLIKNHCLKKAEECIRKNITKHIKPDEKQYMKSQPHYGVGLIFLLILQRQYTRYTQHFYRKYKDTHP
jgi:xanthine/uracil permease